MNRIGFEPNLRIFCPRACLTLTVQSEQGWGIEPLTQQKPYVIRYTIYPDKVVAVVGVEPTFQTFGTRESNPYALRYHASTLPFSHTAIL